MDTHAVLRHHCERYCGAQNLAVVLIGADPLPKLHRMASAAFSAVPRAPLDAPDYSRMPLPFSGVLGFIPAAVRPRHAREDGVYGCIAQPGRHRGGSAETGRAPARAPARVMRIRNVLCIGNDSRLSRRGKALLPTGAHSLQLVTVSTVFGTGTQARSAGFGRNAIYSKSAKRYDNFRIRRTKGHVLPSPHRAKRNLFFGFF